MTAGADVRLIWDELLSNKVPQALAILGYRTTYVGHPTHGAPARGSTDEQVLSYATTSNQVIVTSNHDMMLLCDEASRPFVWIDPFGRQLTRAEQVLLVFRQIDRWAEILVEDGMCVRAQRTKCTAITSSEAGRLATQRMRSLERRRRSRSRASAERTDGRLFE